MSVLSTLGPLLSGVTALAVAVPQAVDNPRVVTSLTTYGSIARAIVGERGEVVSIANGAENPHFVTPRPSLVLQLRRADMFVVTGLDLELWIPAIVDKANNPKVRPGAAPVNAVTIGANILAGLKRVAPENTDYYEQRYASWRDRIIRALVGNEVVDLLGADVVFDLARSHQLLDFLASQIYEEGPLEDRLGGWLKGAESFRNGHMVCYHKEWDYFSRAFAVACDDYVESKPGIPPTPRHVAAVIELMKQRNIHVLFSTNYFDRNQVQSVAQRTDATAVIVPSNTYGAPGIETYEALVDLWIGELSAAFEQAGS